MDRLFERAEDAADLTATHEWLCTADTLELARERAERITKGQRTDQIRYVYGKVQVGGYEGTCVGAFAPLEE